MLDGISSNSVIKLLVLNRTQKAFSYFYWQPRDKPFSHITLLSQANDIRRMMTITERRTATRCTTFSSYCARQSQWRVHTGRLCCWRCKTVSVNTVHEIFEGDVLLRDHQLSSCTSQRTAASIHVRRQSTRFHAPANSANSPVVSSVRYTSQGTHRDRATECVISKPKF